ncbi:CTP synthetase, partial [Halobacteriales archaeon QH_10_67_22]
MNAVFVGPDSQGLVAALEDQGVTVSHVDGIANRPTLEEVGVHEAEL